MNAVEIEEAVSAFAEETFDSSEFPYAFLTAFGNKSTTIKKLRKGDSNKSDLAGGLLQRNNIHIKVCDVGKVGETLKELLESPVTASQKCKYVLSTDGEMIEAGYLPEGETLACEYKDLGNNFTFFLTLAGITTTKQIRENSFDIKATGRFNKLYIELLKNNPDWATTERKEDLNHFFARLIFCFFAEDTNIFNSDDMFTETIEQMSDSQSSNTHEIISEIFRAMNTDRKDRADGDFASWSDKFPYVNGGLFSGNTDVPCFSKIARSYLIHIGGLDWTKINPDIFGSMIQAVADDDERSDVGLHYTSVSNILKVLNPLFLDDLREQLDEAGDSKRKLLNLRNRVAKIRVFDPACGSGNFLVIAYKEMREIEAEINRRRGEHDLHTQIPLTNFRGIEIRNFAAEIARLALIIAEYQCDLLHRGPKLAISDLLPLNSNNWITCGNALRLDWKGICPPTGVTTELQGDDLFNTPTDQSQIDFENEGGETYICGNPPYLGNKLQSDEQKFDMKMIFGNRSQHWRSLDYISSFFLKASEYCAQTGASFALVSTNSICQGQHVPILWPLIYSTGCRIYFAYTSFKWQNLARNSAGVSVVIVGLTTTATGSSFIYSATTDGGTSSFKTKFINAYLAPAKDVFIEKSLLPINGFPKMHFGNMPRDDGNLIFDIQERNNITKSSPEASKYLKDFVGSHDAIHGNRRFCIWVSAEDYSAAKSIECLGQRFGKVEETRRKMKAASTKKFADLPYRFVQIQGVAKERLFLIPRHSSESRYYLPISIYDSRTIVGDSAFALYDSELFHFSVLSSRIHLIWIAAVCGRLKTDYRYSNTLGWNTFPIPTFTEQNKADLTRFAEDILLARESHYPATIADLYKPGKMPANLQEAHNRNDETLERIYIGRRFKNDTERLEKLFELYSKMTNQTSTKKKRSSSKKAGAST